MAAVEILADGQIDGCRQRTDMFCKDVISRPGSKTAAKLVTGGSKRNGRRID